MLKIIVLLAILFTLLNPGCSNPPLFPKKLWVYWHTPIQQAPLFVQLCVQKMRMACEQANWTLYVLNDQNLPLLLPNYQTQFLPVKNNAKHPGWFASVADLIRLAVIDQNGGLYLDISTILFKGLTWFEKLEDYPYLLTNSQIQNGVYPQVLQFYLGWYQSSVQHRDSQGRITNYFPGYQSWFLAGKPKSKYVNALRKRHAYHYVRQSADNWKEDYQKGYYLRNVQGQYLNNQRSAYEVIQQRQFQLDKDLTLFGKRINVNKYHKHVGIHAQFGPLCFYSSIVPKEKFFTHTLKQIEDEYYVSVNFLLKLTNADRPFVDYNFNLLVQLTENVTNIQSFFDEFMESMPSYQQCQNIKFIVQGSLIGEFIKNNSVAIQQNLFSITIEQRNQWFSYCRQYHNIDQTTKPIQFDDRMRMKINATLQFFNLTLGQQLTQKIQYYVKSIAEWQMESVSYGMGAFAHVQQNYYWKQLYKNNNINSSSGQTNETSSNFDKIFANMSYIQKLAFRIKLKILSSQIHFAYVYKIFNYITLIILYLSLFYFGLYWPIKFLCIAYKFIYNYLFIKKKSIRKLLIKKLQPAYLYQLIINKFKSIKQKGIKIQQKQVRNGFNFLKNSIIRLIFGIIFIIFYAIAIYQMLNTIYFGGVFYQQYYLIPFMLTQIFFRKIFSFIGQDRWTLPGLTCGQLLNILLPIYYFIIGCGIVSMVEKLQIRMIALSSSLCLVLPPIIRQIQVQFTKVFIKNQVNIRQIRTDNVYLQRSLQYLTSLLKKFTDNIEIMVIIFLILNYLNENIRYLVSNDKYMLHGFFQKIALLKVLFFIALFIIYGLQIKNKFKTVVKMVKQKIWDKNGKKSYEQLQQQIQKPQSAENAKNDQQIIQQTKNNLNQSQISKQKQKIQKGKCQNSLYYQIISLLIQLIKYFLCGYTYFYMFFFQWQDIMVRNIPALSIQQTVNWLQYQKGHITLKVFGLLSVYFISYSLEHYLNSKLNKCIQIQQKLQQQSSMVQSNISLKDDVQNTKILNYQKSNNLFNNLNLFVTLSQIIFFMLPRFYILNIFYHYFKSIDQNDTTARQAIQLQLLDLLIQKAFIIFVGFKFLNQVISYISRMYLKTYKSKKSQKQSNQLTQKNSLSEQTIE